MGATGLRIGDNSNQLAFVDKDMRLNQLEQGWAKGNGYGGTEKSNGGLNHEEAGIYDANGNLVAMFKGDKHSVTVDGRYLQNGATLTHYHPGDWGGTLSQADVKNFANTPGIKEARAVQSNGDTYIIRDRGNADRAGLNKFVKSHSKIMQRNFDKSYKSNYEKAKKQGMSTPQAKKYARQKSVGAFQRYWKKHLSKYGVDYIVKKSK